MIVYLNNHNELLKTNSKLGNIAAARDYEEFTSTGNAVCLFGFILCTSTERNTSSNWWHSLLVALLVENDDGEVDERSLFYSVDGLRGRPPTGSKPGKRLLSVTLQHRIHPCFVFIHFIHSSKRAGDRFPLQKGNVCREETLINERN